MKIIFSLFFLLSFSGFAQSPPIQKLSQCDSEVFRVGGTEFSAYGTKDVHQDDIEKKVAQAYSLEEIKDILGSGKKILIRTPILDSKTGIKRHVITARLVDIEEQGAFGSLEKTVTYTIERPETVWMGLAGAPSHSTIWKAYHIPLKCYNSYPLQKPSLSNLEIAKKKAKNLLLSQGKKNINLSFDIQNDGEVYHFIAEYEGGSCKDISVRVKEIVGYNPKEPPVRMPIIISHNCQ